MAWHNESEEENKAIWNMDEQRLRVLDELMNRFTMALISKNINEMFDTLEALILNSTCAIETEEEKYIKKQSDEDKEKNELKTIEQMFEALTLIKLNMNTKQQRIKLYSRYHYLSKEIFKLINKHLVTAGFFFRKSEYDEDAI